LEIFLLQREYPLLAGLLSVALVDRIVANIARYSQSILPGQLGKSINIKYMIIIL
jgi:hypothetical protein